MSIYQNLSEALGVPYDPAPGTKINNSTHYFDEKVPSPFKGKKHTDESKELIAAAHRGKVYSEVTLQRMRKAKLGKKASEETKQKLSLAKRGTLNNFYGKSHSQESLEKNRQAHLGKKASSTTRAKLSEQRMGRRWFNDGENEFFASIDKIEPDWKLGRLKRK